MDKRNDEIKKALKNFLTKASKLANIEKVILFGSRARGKFRRNSDVDLLIISNDFENVPFYQRAPRFYLLWEYPNDIEIDILCLTPEEFLLKSRQVSIIREVAKEGIEI